VVVLLLVVMSAIPSAATIGLRVSGLRPAGDPDGAGGIPFAGGPQGWESWHSQSLTEGLVVDAVGDAIVGTPVVVTDNAGSLVAIVITDGEGAFLVQLPTVPNLELALPAEGITGIPVEAGKQILIIVP
jgi:hypothetical protein